MQFYLISKKCSEAKFLYPNGLYSSKKYLFRPLRPFLMIFFKIVCYFAKCARGRFNNPRISGSGEARYDFEMIFTRHMLFAILVLLLWQTIFGENPKAFRNILDLGAVAYFSSTLYKKLSSPRRAPLIFWSTGRILIEDYGSLMSYFRGLFF